jgi:hypothetical protein
MPFRTLYKNVTSISKVVSEVEFVKYAAVDLSKFRRRVPECGVTTVVHPVKLSKDRISWVLVREGGCTTMENFVLGGLK